MLRSQNEIEELNNNEFVKVAIEAYDMAKKCIEYYRENPVKRLFKRKKKFDDSDFQNKANTLLKSIYDEGDLDKELSFNKIWNFCQFIRWAEKVSFYRNEISNNIIIDSSMFAGVENDDPRTIMIRNQSDIKIILKLSFNGKMIPSIEYDSQGNFLLDRGSTEIIEIDVERDYGKKMKNHIIITNSKAAYNDNSDIYLVDVVTGILKKNMYDVTKQILTDIYNRDYIKQFVKEESQDEETTRYYYPF